MTRIQSEARRTATTRSQNLTASIAELKVEQDRLNTLAGESYRATAARLQTFPRFAPFAPMTDVQRLVNKLQDDACSVGYHLEQAILCLIRLQANEV